VYTAIKMRNNGDSTVGGPFHNPLTCAKKKIIIIEDKWRLCSGTNYTRRKFPRVVSASVSSSSPRLRAFRAHM